MLQETCESCERQKKGKPDNCSLCKELDKEAYKNCKTKGG